MEWRCGGYNLLQGIGCFILESAEMALNMCFMLINHSFDLPDIFSKGGSPDPKDPPLDPPLFHHIYLRLSSYLPKTESRFMTNFFAIFVIIEL